MELEIRGVSKVYKGKNAVDHVSARLHQGVYGLLGANGAGKTTLMRMICGVLEPDGGEILYDGENMKSMGERYRELLGYLPQDFGYYLQFTVMEFMLYIASLKGIAPALAKQRSKVLLKNVGLEKNYRTRIKALSGGMKQRLGIAQSLLNDPKILLLDEPTAGLDPKERVRFRNMIAELGKDRIILLSTHIVSDVEEIADGLFMMKDGIILKQGTVESVKKECFNDTSCSLEKVYLHYYEEGMEDDSF
ncbi:MAG: ABC transporter ATP-binding protein [Lachnospiraceae bacterium]